MKTFPFSFAILLAILAGCSGPKQTCRQVIDEARYNSKLSDSLTKKQLAGIEFHAEGNFPANWSLDLDIDKTFDFRSADGNDIKAYPVQAIRINERNALSYTTNTTSGSMNILVFDEPCDAGKKSSRKVEVTVKNKRYTGCGNDLYDYRINDIWVLIKAVGTDLNRADFPKGLPRMEFNLVNSNMLGFDGCNEISAPIVMRGSRIEFGSINGMSKACRNDFVQQIFRGKLSGKSADYYFKDGQLYLYLSDDTLLVFAKTD